MVFALEEGPMPRKIYKPEEIIAKLRQVDVLTSHGQSVAEAIRTIPIRMLKYLTSLSAMSSFQRTLANHNLQEEAPKTQKHSRSRMASNLHINSSSNAMPDQAGIGIIGKEG